MKEQQRFSIILSVSICILAGSYCGYLFGEEVSSTCGDPNGPVYSPLLNTGNNSQGVITFGPEEFPLYTSITNQYSDRGIIFGGDSPRIMEDGSNSTSPVLGTPSPVFMGDIEGYFVSPHDGTTPMKVKWFSFDAGHFDWAGTALIEWFDSENNKLGETFNTAGGFETILVRGEDIARWRIGLFTNDQLGYAIDNVSFGNPYLLNLFKADDVNDDPSDVTCIEPNEEIVYTICYENPTDQTFYNTYIIDYLPVEVDYDPILSLDPLVIDFNYNAEDHSYIWPIGTVGPYDSNCVSLTVTVNERANPLKPLENKAEIWDDVKRLSDTVETTPVCFWDMGNIIYVDPNAPSGGNGLNWPLAYNDLQDALTRIRQTNDPNILFEVRMANGIYNPGNTFDPIDYGFTDTFEIPEGTSVYGGFAGYGSPDPDERNMSKYPTILSGYIRTVGDLEIRNEKVVVMNNDVTLNGVTVEKGNFCGIYGSNVNFTIVNCSVRNNSNHGIKCQNSSLTIDKSSIELNNYDGIYHHSGDHSHQLNINNSIIANNRWNGICCLYSAPKITNSIIRLNGTDHTTQDIFYGVKINNPSEMAILRNNTIICNENAGVYYTGSPENAPKVKNCILWRNAESNQFTDFEGFSPTINCCLTDPNHPDDVVASPQPDRLGNIVTCPDFAYSDIAKDNLHLAYNSPCVDAGDPNETDISETDIDGEQRVFGLSIDIGADEACSCEGVLSEDDIYNALDWNADGVVNYVEFDVLARSWLALGSPNPNLADPNYNPTCDFNIDWVVDEDDLAEFISNWLWTACWRLDLRQTQQITQQSSLTVGNELSISNFSVLEPSRNRTENLKTDIALLLSVLKDIEDLSESSGREAQAWQKLKTALEKSLKEMEDARHSTVDF